MIEFFVGLVLGAVLLVVALKAKQMLKPKLQAHAASKAVTAAKALIAKAEADAAALEAAKKTVAAASVPAK
jgi:hypothetical protein